MTKFFTDKQMEFWQNANSRWNVKTGATRSGKTYMDYYVIPKRIREADPTGEIVLLGHTQSTIERNVITPLRRIWGNGLVGNISSNNTINLFGRQCYALGADKKNQVEKIQGMGISYAYGDEVTTWSQNVFEMLKSRLDRPTSKFDGTCNPEGPKHWFKEFLDSDADIYHLPFTIYDNDFLSDNFIKELEKEYEGTVYFDRYILGRWARAEGIIYRMFADDPDKYKTTIEDIKPKVTDVKIGVDFGGNKANHTFVAMGIIGNYEGVVALYSQKLKATLTPEQLFNEFTYFVTMVMKEFPMLSVAYPDSAEQVLIRGMKSKEDRIVIRGSKKLPINDRIHLVASLISRDKFYWTDEARTVKEALEEAVWDEDKEDERLDDGTTDIDTLDAMEYAIERDARRLMRNA